MSFWDRKPVILFIREKLIQEIKHTEHTFCVFLLSLKISGNGEMIKRMSKRHSGSPPKNFS